MRRALRLLVLPFALSRCACDDGSMPPPDPPCGRRVCAANECGEFLDGCGGILRCPSCAASETCGGAGVANQCGPGTCRPESCFEQGKNCNFISDGCSKVLDCGRCRRPTDCGKFSKPSNVCGGPSCDKVTCGDRCSGFIDDGCGGMLDCNNDGGCSQPWDTCGGGGDAGHCGCTPRTCADLGKRCGESSDTCGKTLACGACDPLVGTCGGGGFPNLCGDCGAASGGRVCTPSCWCWDAPRPTGNRIGAITAASASGVWLFTPGRTFVRGDDVFGFVGVPEPLDVTPRNAWAKSDTEVYAASAQGLSQMVRFDGTSWQIEPVPTFEALNGVWGVGSEVWAVGTAGAIFHKRSGLWHPEGDGGAGFDDVWASGPADVWAAGDQLRHFDGGQWSPSVLMSHVYDVHGTAPDDVWFADSLGLSHFDGASFQRMNPGHLARRVVAIARDDVWVGGVMGYVSHYDGVAFRDAPLPTSDEVSALWARGHDDVWVATATQLFHRDATGWHVISSQPNADLLGVYVASPSEAWAVGQAGRVLLYDGFSWRPVASVMPRALYAISGSGGRVWAVGELGTIVTMRDGGLVTETSPASPPLTAVFAVSANEVYAAGTNMLLTSDGGGTWLRLTSPTTAPLGAIWGTSDHDLWVGDSNGRVHHLDDAGWHLQPTGFAAPVNALWGEGSSVFAAVGDLSSGFGAVLFNNGDGGWASLSGPSMPYTGAWGSSASDVWFAGAHGTLAHWNGTTFTPRVSPTANDLRSLSGATSAPVFAVGAAGAVVRVNAGPARREVVAQEHVDDRLFAVYGFSGSDLWAVGESGNAHHFDGQRWQTHQVPAGSSSTRTLNAVWGAAPDDVWATGWQGRMVHFDGGSWSAVPAPAVAPSNASLKSMWGTAANDLWAVGGSVIARWDGAAWSANVLSGTPQLQAVHGSARDDAWVVGAQLWHFDGLVWVQVTNPVPGAVFSSLWCAARDACWAVGLEGPQSVVARWDGTRWSAVPFASQTAAAVWGRGRDDVFIFGRDGSIQRWDGVSFTGQHSGTNGELNAAWGCDAGIWTVGWRTVLFHPP